MANDNYYVVSGETLSQFAEALRVLDGTSQPLEWFNGFAGALWSIAGKMADVQPLNVTQNGTYTAPTGTAYSPVTVNVSGGGGTDYLAARLSNTLTTYSSNDVTRVPDYALRGVSSLQTISLPNATAIGRNAFTECTNLTSATFSADITSVGQYAFSSCPALEEIDLKKASSIGANCFNGDSKLNTIILRKTNGVTSIASTSAISGTPFASGGAGGTLYVPQDLIASYQSASNWSTILGYANNQIKKIEGSVYE